MISLGDFGNILGGQFFMGAADHGAHLASVDKQGLFLTVTEAPLGIAPFVLGEEPEAHGDLGGVEQLGPAGRSCSPPGRSR